MKAPSTSLSSSGGAAITGSSALTAAMASPSIGVSVILITASSVPVDAVGIGSAASNEATCSLTTLVFDPGINIHVTPENSTKAATTEATMPLLPDGMGGNLGMLGNLKLIGGSFTNLPNCKILADDNGNGLAGCRRGANLVVLAGTTNHNAATKVLAQSSGNWRRPQSFPRFSARDGIFVILPSSMASR